MSSQMLLTFPCCKKTTVSINMELFSHTCRIPVERMFLLSFTFTEVHTDGYMER